MKIKVSSQEWQHSWPLVPLHLPREVCWQCSMRSPDPQATPLQPWPYNAAPRATDAHLAEGWKMHAHCMGKRAKAHALEARHTTAGPRVKACRRCVSVKQSQRSWRRA